jgi:hypothetical protein
LAINVEGGAAKVVSVLFEAKSDGCWWDGVGEVLEPQLQGVGHDDPFVPAGTWMGEAVRR